MCSYAVWTQVELGLFETLGVKMNIQGQRSKQAYKMMKTETTERDSSTFDQGTNCYSCT